MGIMIDSSENKIKAGNDEFELYSPEGFRYLSDLWLKVAWDQKHPYSFTWLGRPIIQNPEDVLRMQEIVWAIKPDIIIETGVAHGGSLIFYASLLDNMRKGKVIGVDVEIRPDNQKALEAHPLFNKLCLVEGSSITYETLIAVKSEIPENANVMVVLDSSHTREHVKKELEMYSPLVTEGSYIVVTDGSQKYLGDTPRAIRDYKDYASRWENDNPLDAIKDFLIENTDFECSEPEFMFNESQLDFRITHWPNAFLKRISDCA